MAADNFWLGMGLTVSVGMLIGGTFYNGDLTKAGKGIAMLFSYILLLTFFTYSRVAEVGRTIGFSRPEQAYAGMVTTLVVSFFYLLGIYIGVFYLRWMKRNNYPGHEPQKRSLHKTSLSGTN